MAAVPPAVLSAPRSLATLRHTIDSIDDSIHDLLMRRAEIVGEVARAKAREGGAGAPLFRPGREAEILRRLVARHRGPLPPTLIVRLWRAMIVEHTRLQGPLAVAVGPGAAGETARDHFGPDIVRPLRSPAAVLAAVAKRRVQLGVLPPPGGRAAAGAWWRHLPAGVHVLARLPFFRAGRAPARADAVVIGRQTFESSGDDVIYIAVAWAKGAGRRPTLPGGRAIATARRSGRAITLFETTAPIQALRDRVGASGTIEFLGGYARPIVPAATRK